MRFLILLVSLLSLAVASDVYYYKSGVKTTLYPLSQSSRGVTNIDYYENEQGRVLGVSNRIIVKMQSDTNLQNYLLEYNLTLKSSFGNSLYLLQTSDKNITIKIANLLNEKADIEYAHPDFFKKRVLR